MQKIQETTGQRRVTNRNEGRDKGRRWGFPPSRQGPERQGQGQQQAGKGQQAKQQNRIVEHQRPAGPYRSKSAAGAPEQPEATEQADGHG